MNTRTLHRLDFKIERVSGVEIKSLKQQLELEIKAYERVSRNYPADKYERISRPYFRVLQGKLDMVQTEIERRKNNG